MHKISLLAILALLFCSSINAQTTYYFPVQTKIEKGIIEGNYDTRSGMQFYFGVPFAKPPVGQLRWKAPQPLDNWIGVKSTKKFGPRPIQAVVYGDMNSRSDGLSEDCLYLNVWSPKRADAKLLPVLVYFYGGGFVAGDASEPRYDGESMAKKGMVVVTVNYRLNIFGFFAHPELSAEAPYKASGNYALLDQNESLKWVQKNIAQFGGDPKRVTIAGESAGSISVSEQMASPLSKNLIAGAIGESGAAINPTLAPVPLKEAEKIGFDFAKNAGYNSIAALRKLSTREIFEMYNASKRFGFPVVIDGYFLTANLPQTFRAGKQAMVPLLAGWNTAEIPGQAFMQGSPYTVENFIDKVKKTYPSDYEEVLKLYPHSNEKEVELSATELASDRFISYSTWKWAELHADNSKQPVYRYLFGQIKPSAISKGPKASNMPKPVGASHASEIEYCMGNLESVKDVEWTDEDRAASATMQQFFANFILTGNPNGANLPKWSPMAPNELHPEIMLIEAQSKAIKADTDDRYRFLDKSYKNDQ